MTTLALKPQAETVNPESDTVNTACFYNTNRLSINRLYSDSLYPNSLYRDNASNSLVSTAKAGSDYRYPVLQPNINRYRVAEPDRPYQDFQQLKFTAVTTVAREHAKHISASVKQSSSKPCLQLSGNWLEKAGFIEDARCLVEVYKGMLVVTLDE